MSFSYKCFNTLMVPGSRQIGITVNFKRINIFEKITDNEMDFIIHPLISNDICRITISTIQIYVTKRVPNYQSWSTSD